MKVLKSVITTLVLTASVLQAALWDNANTIYNDTFSLTVDNYTAWGNLMNGYDLTAETTWDDYAIKPETVIGSVIDYWDSLLATPVTNTINIYMDMSALSGMTLASVSHRIYNTDFLFMGPNGQTFNSFTTAEAKAKGFLGDMSLFTGYDMSITFSSEWPLSFTETVDPNGADFQSVLLHEITHSMGFKNKVSYNEETGNIEWGKYLTAFDALLGVQAGDTIATGEAFYVTIDGVEYPLYNPEEYTASSFSHFDWEVDSAMNPGIITGVTKRELTSADLAVLQALGYNLNTIPEPSSAMLAIFGVGILLTRRRRI